MSPVDPLTPEALYAACDTTEFDFETTDELVPLDALIGQDRAVEAVCFGISIRSEGYNIYALGPPGIGKRTLIGDFLDRQAKDEAVPSDWCYVNNFADRRRPRALRLPAGRGRSLANDMDRLIRELRTAIPAAFQSDTYRSRREAIEAQFRQRQQEASEELQRKAEERNVAIVRTQMGLGIAPVKDGKIVEPDAFENLPESERQAYTEAIEELQKELQAHMEEVPKWAHELREAIRALNREVAMFAVQHNLSEFKKAYADLPEVVAWLDSVEADLIENAEAFIQLDGQQEGMQQQAWGQASMFGGLAGNQPSFQQYTVNVVVDHGESAGAPVHYEDNPTIGNLIGRIEYTAHQGALVTNFSLIKAGALHGANGGYLVVEAHKLLFQPFAWDALKRALRAGHIRVQPQEQSHSLADMVSLDPEPVPLEIKIVLVGDRRLYYLLSELDPDFLELFKVQADFEEDMKRSSDNVVYYARMIADIVRRESLRPLDKGAVARVIEEAARIAGDSGKLTTHMRTVADLVREADYWARMAKRETVVAEDVQKAIDAFIHRSDRLRERTREAIVEGMVLIATEGETVGQVNGLAVTQLGGYAFGRPSRITARVQLGRGRVVDIEREVELGGALHSKGVLILSGFLGARFGESRPIALSASLVFEQSYGGIDGDSASSAELYALLSAIGDVPIRQAFAVTGSVNQRGEVQAIGGVNEKIEGFFDICREKGLTGEQGVLIPASNLSHLMLRRDVVDAVREGKFTIWPVATIDQGIEILTGLPAGERGADGTYPEGSVNRRVEDRLAAFAQAALKYSAGPDRQRDGGEV